MAEPFALPWLTPKARRRAKKIYDGAWARGRNGGPWALPEGTISETVATPLGDVQAHHVPGDEAVVLAHPDRRYGGHWFVKEGWVQTFQDAGKAVYWFDQPGYGQGQGGSPYLAENVGSVARHAANQHDTVDVVGVSLGAFAAAIMAPHVPEVRRIVLESPYVDFVSWYDNHGFSVGKMVAKSFGWIIPGGKHLNARDALRDAPQDVMVSLSHVDTVTPPDLSEAVVDRHVTWYRSHEAEHLALWQEPAYREAVLDFLA